MAQLEALLADDPHDPFLRYGLALEHASAGDDDTAATVLAALTADAPDYVPAYLMRGQALGRLGREPEAAEVLRAGIAAAERVSTPEALHARGEMAGLLSTLE
jgi:predicted Zn-dependent protease